MKPYAHFKAKNLGKVRTNQEDYIEFCDELDLFVLADGAGGHADGEVASKSAAEETIKRLKQLVGGVKPRTMGEAEVFLREAIRYASEVVDKLDAKNPPDKKMCSTIVVVWVRGDVALVANVGDSRAYMIGQDSIVQLTIDHNYERVYLNEGYPPEKAERMYNSAALTQAIGNGLDEISIKTIPFTKGDTILVCSDGLTDMLEDREIHRIVSQKNSGKEVVSELIDAANKQGGRDNISVILIQNSSENAARDAGSLDPMGLSREALQQNSLFKDLSELERNELLAIAKYRAHAPGDLLIREDDPANEIWILLSGSYLVTHKNSDGERIQPIAVRKGGEVIGHAALFKEGKRSVTLKAISELQALTIHKDDFYDLAISKQPQIGIKIMLRLIRESHNLLDSLTRAVANAGH